MPQMAPMNWIFLYLMFTITFILFNFLNYYIFLASSSSTESKTFIFKTLNWKW